MIQTFQIRDDINDAIQRGKPVVTLESTIISFGLPHPQNLEVARECEEIVREEGALPATVGIVDGVMKVGLSEQEIESFATRKDIVKTNLGNISPVCASWKWGATTVSSTLFATVKAGAGVFVTGGIGGVHKGFGDHFDISSDLTALKEFGAVVVCAGVKSLLDVPATLEHLETLGIPVVGYGTDFFPVFYIPKSAREVDRRVDTPQEAALVFRVQKRLGLASSVLVTAPVPAADALTREEVSRALEKAEKVLSERSDIRGRDVTPFLLRLLSDYTGGRTLKANLSLVRNNVRIGARIACSLAESS